MKAFFAVPILGGIIFSVNAQQAYADTSNVKIILTSQIQRLIPQTRFSCAGSIYAFMTFPPEYDGKHVLEGRWIRPDGELQENPRVEVQLTPEGGRIAYLFMEFAEDSVFDDIKLGDYGRSNEFNGAWRFEAQLDGAEMIAASFTVQCP